MNPLTEILTKGTFGELLVQLRLLQFGVQAVPLINNNGIDLIAIWENEIRAIRVITITEFPENVSKLPDPYRILAVVLLDPMKSGTELSLDRCKVFLFSRSEVQVGAVLDDEWGLLSKKRIEQIFQEHG